MSREEVREHLLVLRCQVGDEHAFSILFSHFGARTHRYLESLLGGALADDAQQEVWVSVYRRIAHLANPGAFRTWLFQITRHHAIDVLRREKREERLKTAVSDSLTVDPPTNELDLSSRLEEPALRLAMSALSETHREVLILRFWEEMSYAQIALLVGKPIGTVRSRLHHAKEQLRLELEQSRLGEGSDDLTTKPGE